MLQDRYFRMEPKWAFVDFGCTHLGLCSFIFFPRQLTYSKIFLGVHDLGTSHRITTFACEICALKPFLGSAPEHSISTGK